MIERYSRAPMKKIWAEDNKFKMWLKVELAVCEAWADIGVVPADAIPLLKKARFDLNRYEEAFRETHHDMNAFLRTVAQSVGEEGRFIHLGLTSYDVQDTALSLQLKESASLLGQDIDEAITAVSRKAVEHKNTIMMGRTHGVHAEPITFGLKLAVWVEEMRRHALRLAQAKKAISVGKISGAVGSYATVPPEVEAKACARLGLTAASVSNQVLQRDRHAQFVVTLALIASSLEKFGTEIRGLQRTEVLEVEEPFAEGQTGSSAMPHKRNPELSERLCGLARLVRGHALTAMENIALWHERDISHSSAERVILPDSCLVVDYGLNIFTSIMNDLQVYPAHMQENLGLTRGLVFSQRVMLALIDKGLSRQQAYKIVQRNAMRAWRERTHFLDLLRGDVDISACLSESELAGLFDYQYFVRHVDEVFDRVGLLKSARNDDGRDSSRVGRVLRRAK